VEVGVIYELALVDGLCRPVNHISLFIYTRDLDSGGPAHSQYDRFGQNFKQLTPSRFAIIVLILKKSSSESTVRNLIIILGWRSWSDVAGRRRLDGTTGRKLHLVESHDHASQFYPENIYTTRAKSLEP